MEAAVRQNAKLLHSCHRNASETLRLHNLFEPICFLFFLKLKKRATPLCTSPPLRRLFLNSTSTMWNKGESEVYYSAISVSRDSLQVKQMERVCELQTWPAPRQLQHGFTPVTDFIANCGEPEYGEVVVIKRFNGMLGALDFDCFFFPPFLRSLLSNVRGHY